MATYARPMADENAPLGAKGMNGAGANNAGARRALGDIANVVGPLNGRAGPAGKENVAKKDAKVDALQVPGRITRSRAQANNIELQAPQPWLGARKPRLPGKPDEAEAERKAKSWSSVLESRSEQVAAASSCQKADPFATVSPLDIGDLDNPLAVAAYVNDIFSYYKRVEPQFRVAPDYMSRQSDINEKMRAILIDWLVEVHLKFKLMPETMFLTTNLIDRFLELKQVTRRNLQLVGVTAMLIASKYEEIWAPEVRDFVYISDRAYSKEQILQMEKIMLNTLRFNLTVPTTFNFLLRFLKASGDAADKEMSLFSNYLVELALPEYGMLKYSYSLIAAASVYAARLAFGKGEAFPADLHKASGFSEAIVRSCASDLAKLHLKAPNASLHAVYKKYSNVKLMEVAKRAGPAELVPEQDA